MILRNIKFYEDLRDCLWDAWKFPCMSSCKLGFNIHKCSRNWNCLVTSDASLPYRNSRLFLERFLGYTEMLFIVLCKPGYVVCRCGWKSKISKILVKVSRVKFEKNLSDCVGADSKPDRQTVRYLHVRHYFLLLEEYLKSLLSWIMNSLLLRNTTFSYNVYDCPT
jgi:hypothetical protein